MASGKATTRKLTGKAKDNFFDSGLSPEQQKAAVTSLQVRKELWPVSRDLRPRRNEAAEPPPATKPHAKARTPEPVASPALEPQATSAPPAAAASSTGDGVAPAASEAAAGKFDPFVFGLVPVYKREGAGGLAARLAEIEDVENLRAMAKAQQIVLPREVRRGDAAIETVRTAVLAAVEQRVSDRKAQM